MPDTERARRPPAGEDAEVYRELLADEPAPRKRRTLRGGLLGLTALGLAGWAFRGSRNKRKEPPGSSD